MAGMDARQQGTHLPLLMRTVLATEGAILEIGVGDFSTPVLQRYCYAAGRELVSVDDLPEWHRRFSGEYGGVLLVDYDRDLPALAAQPWAIVFVDHWPGERRARDALLFRDSAGVVLVHDFKQLQKEYRPLRAAWPNHNVEFDTLVLRP